MWKARMLAWLRIRACLLETIRPEAVLSRNHAAVRLRSRIPPNYAHDIRFPMLTLRWYQGVLEGSQLPFSPGSKPSRSTPKSFFSNSNAMVAVIVLGALMLLPLSAAAATSDKDVAKKKEALDHLGTPQSPLSLSAIRLPPSFPVSLSRSLTHFRPYLSSACSPALTT